MGLDWISGFKFRGGLISIPFLLAFSTKARILWIFRNQFITQGFTSTQFKNPCFLGDFFSKIFRKKRKAFLGVVALICFFFSFWQKYHTQKKWPLRSQEKYFLKEFWCSLNGVIIIWRCTPQKKMTTYHSEEDLAKSGYKLNMKYKIFCQPFLFMARHWKPNSKICQFLLFIF
jgi:hypothetical protein